MSSILETLYPPRARQRLRPGGEIERLLEPADEPSLRRREEVETVLAYANAQGWFDHPIRQRLASGDDTVMLAALNELAVARFLHLRGAQLEPNPPGRGRRIGEYLVRLPAASFFVEVKTLISPLQDTYRSAAEYAIAEAADGITVPAVIDVELQSAPSSGVSIRDLRFYLEQSVLQLLSGAHEPPAYIHRSGMAFRVLRASALDSDNDHRRLQVRFVDWPAPIAPRTPAEDRWRERLLRALRGAYEQLPSPAAPSMVVIVDHCDATGGNLELLLTAVNGGFLRPNQHRRLSAIAYHCPLAQLEAGDEHMSVIHNPWASSAISGETLQLPDLHQICLLPR